ncbi:hypothetical protein [Rhodanobacter sp. DHB23]|uniref:hypothetical protein n=1 Tax=Rhodanobacter sp. DHB23 TaxID=2775923 RepID=UPI00177BA8CD|nr:hypothetical protein [Rhodanobacter sp. DHB23]MBD8874016.1 hypothetical protein [Rhodanobacter sp. DHB23]
MGVFKHHLILVSAFLVAGCATMGPPMETQDDFRAMAPDVVLQLVQPGSRQLVYDSEESHGWDEKYCLENNTCVAAHDDKASTVVIGQPDWSLHISLMKQLLIGCANDADTSNSDLKHYLPNSAMAGGFGYCALLAESFADAGNLQAARAIIFHAPGCKSVDQAGNHLFKCNITRVTGFGGVLVANVFSDDELYSLARDALLYDPSDEWAANFLISRGVHINMSDVMALAKENDEANREAVRGYLNQIHQQDEEHQARFDAIIGALRDAGGGSPTAILDEGNRQAAAIRAIGNANAGRTTPLSPPNLATQVQGALASVTPVAANESAATSEASVAQSGTATSVSQLNFLSPLPASCVHSYPDQQYYNWLSLQNTCGQAIYVTYIFRKPTGWAMSGGMTLAPGAHQNTGDSAADVNNAGGMLLYVCPANSIPVDGNGHVFTTNVSQYKCESQG